MFKYAIIFLVLSLIAGGLGLTNFSVLFKRIALVFFVLFFLRLPRAARLCLSAGRSLPTPAPAPN